MTKLKITYRKISELKANPKNARVHSEHQIQQIADIIREVGFNVPISLDANDMIIAGHGRLAAAELIGMKEVPTVDLRHLSERQVRAYALADNRIALSSTWDFEILSKELAALVDDDFDISIIGFNEQEIDALLKSDADILPDDFNGPGQISVGAHERPPAHPSGSDPFADQGIERKNQYGVIVICDDEKSQIGIFERLQSEGYKCKVVVT